ncbi:lysozyme inhibitor LprI family protein [Xanthomonas translucens]|uniref:lysozyme inhibitor LprI family protein n=1 Tax=Xanthomonas campestris pv. translucens TaxID=343 RepID=UPI001E2B9353|nr:lysozyme inhibitor LprI family protein [Xanthomonas translucens]
MREVTDRAFEVDLRTGACFTHLCFGCNLAGLRVATEVAPTVRAFRGYRDTVGSLCALFERPCSGGVAIRRSDGHCFDDRLELLSLTRISTRRIPTVAIVKLLPVSCLLALCAVTAACNGGSSTPAPTAASTAAAAPAATPAPAPTTGDAPAANAQAPSAPSTQADAAAKPSKPSGETVVLRPSYDACISAAAGVTPTMQDCIDTEYAYQDDRLNTVYKALMAKLGDAEKHTLREQQRIWIAERDEKCFYDPDSGQAGRVDAAECRLDMTAKRADELAAR